MSSHEDEHLSESTGGGLRSHLDAVRRRKWIVVIVVAIAVGIAAALSYARDPVYRAETKIVIGQGQSLFQVSAGNSIQPFTATMSDLLESNVVATSVIQQLRLDLSQQALLANLSVSINPQTAVITARYDDTDAARAQQILQQVGLVFSQLVHQRFGADEPQSGSAGEQAAITATVFDPAHALPGQISPQPVRNLVLAGVLGLLLGLLAVFLREHFDRALRTREAVERAFAVPVIGQVPFERSRRKTARKVAWDGTGEIAEAYRGLRANLQYLAVQRPLRTILVTSAAPEQGKTTVTANLGVAITRSGASTVVIEADLRRPRLDGALGVAGGGPGLTSVLVGTAALEDVLRDVELPPETPGAGRGGRLSFLPSGPLPPNPSELLSSPQMRQLLDRLSVTFDYVLIDSPPVLLVADALELARSVDGVVLTVRRNRSTTDEGRELRALVERLGIHVVGVVLTDVAASGSYGVYGDERSQPEARPQRQEAEPEPVAAVPAAPPSVSDEL